MAGGDVLEGGPSPRGDIRQALAPGKLEPPDVGHPRLEGRGIERPNLGGRQALPAPHGELAERRQRDRLEPMGPREDLGGPSRAREVAAIGRGELGARELPPEGRRLRFARG